LDEDVCAFAAACLFEHDLEMITGLGSGDVPALPFSGLDIHANALRAEAGRVGTVGVQDPHSAGLFRQLDSNVQGTPPVVSLQAK
jgi:hypothetical protein